MAGEKPKLCIDCFFYCKDYVPTKPICMHKEAFKGIELVHGNEKRLTCETMRTHFVYCGSDGQYFQPKKRK